MEPVDFIVQLSESKVIDDEFISSFHCFKVVLMSN